MLKRSKEWWMARARREPDVATTHWAASLPCLCLYAIEQREGEPAVHDPRCTVVSRTQEDREQE